MSKRRTRKDVSSIVNCEFVYGWLATGLPPFEAIASRREVFRKFCDGGPSQLGRIHCHYGGV